MPIPKYCSICYSAKSVGMNCNLITCAACKMFIKRHNSDAEKLKCLKGHGGCEIHVKSEMCKRCRFENAVKFGMRIYETFPLPPPLSCSKNSFKLIRTLGSGGFGDVFLVESKSINTSNVFALKKIRKERKTAQTKLLLQREVGIQTNLQHPNILMCYGYFEADDLYILTEALLFGDLENLLVELIKSNRVMDRWKCTAFGSDLVGVVAYIHHRRIAHRDIKPSNILLTGTGFVKLCDLGLAKQVGQKMNHSKSGTFGFMPPEEPIGDLVFKADIWAFGVIIAFMVTGKYPFATSDQMIREMVHLPNGIPEEENEVIRKLLTIDPKVRPTAATIKSLKWPSISAQQRLLEHQKGVIKGVEEIQYPLSDSSDGWNDTTYE